MSKFIMKCSCRVPSGRKKSAEIVLIVLFLAVALGIGFFDDDPYSPDIPVLLHSPRFFNHEEQAHMVTFVVVPCEKVSLSSIHEECSPDRAPPMS